jgi:predicted nucleotidyltransferase
MKTIEEIKTILANCKEELKRRYGVIEIGIFGSYVRGEQREDSDLDVLVDFDRQLSLLDLASLKNFLTDLLGIEVDIVPKKNIYEPLRENILKEVIML